MANEAGETTVRQTSSAVERSVRRGNCFQISTGRGCKRATHPIYRSEFTWGAVRVKETEGEKQRGESGPFSLSCHWGSQLCNKACWVLIRLCGFGQERKNTPPVMTWHLLPDSHWGRTKSWTKLSSEATEPHSCDRPPGCEHLRKDEGSWGDWDHGRQRGSSLALRFCYSWSSLRPCFLNQTSRPAEWTRWTAC